MACYSTGNVTATITDGYANVGGVVGINGQGTVTACYHATGEITSLGGGRIGGIVGENYIGTVAACYWQNDQAQGIGEDQTSKGEATKVEGSTTWEIAMNAMNAALSGTGWQYVTGGSDAPLTLQKQ